MKYSPPFSGLMILKKNLKENFGYPTGVSMLLVLFLTRIRRENSSLPEKKLHSEYHAEGKLSASSMKQRLFYRILKVQHLLPTNCSSSLRETLLNNSSATPGKRVSMILT